MMCGKSDAEEGSARVFNELGYGLVCKRKRRSPRLTGWAPASELLGVDGWAQWVDAPGIGPEASALFGWRVASSGKYYNE
jgi:hypothetical protein